MTNTGKAPSAPPSTSLPARLGGLVADLFLLASFLGVATAALQILIAVIVLVVGIVQRVAASGSEPRLIEDGIGLVLSVGAFMALALVFWGVLRVRRALLARSVDSVFETYISKRYLVSREGGSLVSLIAVVSVLGVAIGVTALVVVISVMNGFNAELKSRIISVLAHIEVIPAGGVDATFSRREYARSLEEIRRTPGVVAAAPTIQRQTLFQADTGGGEAKVGGAIFGIDADSKGSVDRLLESVISGGKARPGSREVVMGSELARRLAVLPGDKVYVFGRVVTTANGSIPRLVPLRVVGLFKTGLYDVDSALAYTDIETAQSVFTMGDEVNALHIMIDDPMTACQVRAGMMAAGALPPVSMIRTWQERSGEFFKALWLERVAMFIILMFIVIVASFNIIGTLVMTVAQKTREIGILKSMGASSRSIMFIFLTHGLLIGLIGTALGISWGLWICRFVSNDIEKIFQLPSAIYGLDRLPVLVEAPVIAFIVCCTMGVCVLASIVPSLRASRLNPVEALRYE